MNQEAIKVQPLPKNPFSDGCPDIQVDVDALGQVGKRINRDSSEISVLGCDGLECQGDPSNFQRSEPKNHILELRSFREVERNRSRLVYKRK